MLHLPLTTPHEHIANTDDQIKALHFYFFPRQVV
jgi:hypothetical protein